MAYIGTQTGERELYVRHADGTSTLIPHLPGMILYRAALAPDGHTVAFTLTSEQSFPYGNAYIGDIADGNIADGEELRTITDLGGTNGGFVWKADSSAVGFYHEDPRNYRPAGAYVYSLTEGFMTPAMPGVKTVGSPSFSPDGTITAALISDPAVGFGLYGLRAGSTTPFPIVENVNAGTPAWTPDGRYLVFAQFGELTEGLSVSDLSGHTARLTSSSTTSDTDPHVANDWTVYFRSNRDTDEVDHIYKMKLGTDVIERAIGEPGFQYDVALADTRPVDPQPEGFPPSGLDPAPTTTTTSTTTTVAPTTTTTTTPPPPTSCPKLEFIGVRGSGEYEYDNYGFGNPVGRVRDIILSRLPGMHVDHINYPSIAVGYGGVNYGAEYLKSIDDGEEKLDKLLDYYLDQCSTTTYLVLVGYSQGAQVVGDVFERLNRTERRRIAAVVLFGDPRFNPRQRAVDNGDYNPKLQGVWQWVSSSDMLLVPTDSIPDVRSYCTSGDPVCNYSKTNLAFCEAKGEQCPHVEYISRGWTDVAAISAVNHVRKKLK